MSHISLGDDYRIQTNNFVIQGAIAPIPPRQQKSKLSLAIFWCLGGDLVQTRSVKLVSGSERHVQIAMYYIAVA